MKRSARPAALCSRCSTKRNMIPAGGEVWLFDLGMAAKVRPVLVVSVPFADIDRALVTVVPHTTELRASAYEAPIKAPFLLNPQSQTVNES